MRSTMIRMGTLAVGVAAMLATTCTCALAASVISLSTNLVCPDYSNILSAAITRKGDLYHYEYTLSFTDTCKDPNDTTPACFTMLSIGNTSNCAFSDAGNDAGLVNPEYNVTSNNSIIWCSTTGITAPKRIKMWYDSIHAYQEVSATMVAGKAASGSTLGMVPEPGTIVSLGLGLLGLGGGLLRRR